MDCSTEAFWKMNKDIYQNATVIGIGDMAGDLFGNGMLLSKIYI